MTSETALETPTTDPPQIPIHQAMARVMASIGAVDKGGFNEKHQYKFRGIDQFMNALHPALVAHGVVVLPKVLDREVQVRDRSNGVTTHVWLRVQYRFIGPAGDDLEVVVDGESADTFDKATNKALSAALKYAVLQTFMVPTEDQRDGDNDSPDMGGSADLAERLEAERQMATAAAGTTARAEWYKLVAGLDEDLKRQLRGWCDSTGTPAHPARQDDDQFAAFRSTVTTLIHGGTIDDPAAETEPVDDNPLADMAPDPSLPPAAPLRPTPAMRAARGRGGAR